MGPTLRSLSRDLEQGRTTARALVEGCLAAIEDSSGEGRRVFIRVDAQAARAAADAADMARRAGVAPSPFAGIPISIKDLFDIRGQTTGAGSTVLADAPPAAEDAPTVARLRRLGFVLIGRTNMTEFAYSGLGLNPHYGTPASPWRRDEGRIPGGSSSGAAISVTDGMAHAGLGTDTGGSCRIPAAFTGIVGWKPTASRVPLEGAVPLSPSLDSVGPLARSVECCRILDAVLSGSEIEAPASRDVRGLRLAVPTTIALNGLDEAVSSTFERALDRLSAAGALVERIAFPEFDEIAKINAKGGFTGPESFAWHRDLLAAKRDGYDPRVSVRILRGEAPSAADYLDAQALRRAMVAAAARRLSPYDALALPTVAVAPPRIADLVEDDDAYTQVNLQVLRNCTLINMIDGCAISLPIHREGEAPVGLMLAGAAGWDSRVFGVAAGIEALFQAERLA
jgi:aspartyl-tRNA(Asn)/glutamyl-tRNA(Gln) amidotransferase subunit A